jgi:peroxiredoxin
VIFTLKAFAQIVLLVLFFSEVIFGKHSIVDPIIQIGSIESSWNCLKQQPDSTDRSYPEQNPNHTFYSEIDYSVEILNDSGEVVKLKEWEGKNLLIIYAHTDCSYCKNLVKKLQEELKENSQLNTIILFPGYEIESSVKEFVDETMMDYPYFFDRTSQFKKKYGTGFTPTTLFIKEDGTGEHIKGLKTKLIEDLIHKVNKISK